MEQQCRECGFDASEIPVADVADALGALTPTLVEHIRAIPDDDLRCRPATGVWAPIEYLGHLRDAMGFHRWLIERATAEKAPEVPAVDPDAAVAEADHRHGDVEALLVQFVRRVERLREILGDLPDDTSGATIALDGRPLSVPLIARSAWHECHHHDLDITAVHDQT